MLENSRYGLPQSTVSRLLPRSAALNMFLVRLDFLVRFKHFSGKIGRIVERSLKSYSMLEGLLLVKE